MSYKQQYIIKQLAKLSGTDVDTRWVSLPIMSFLAYTIGDVSLWIIVLVFIGSFKIYVKL
jgi:hypothetical protein